MSKIEELEKEIKELKAKRDSIEQQIETKVKKIEDIEKNTQYFINTFGEVEELTYFKKGEQEYWDIVKQGNVFNSKKEAVKEAKKRALKFEIEELRKERNGDWQPNWKDNKECKYHLAITRGNEVTVTANYYVHSIPEFGSFQKIKDAEFAMKVFGARILELYAD